MIFPEMVEIIEINRRHLAESGHVFIPPDNLKSRGSLSWVLDTVQYPLFCYDAYPTWPEKAAQLTWIIISGHVFWDGCKRTGMSTMLYFAKLNGYESTATQDDIVAVALKIATDTHYTSSDLSQWVREKFTFRHDPRGYDGSTS